MQKHKRRLIRMALHDKLTTWMVKVALLAFILFLVLVAMFQASKASLAGPDEADETISDVWVQGDQSCCGTSDPCENPYPLIAYNASATPNPGKCTWWAKYKRPDLPCDSWHDAGPGWVATAEAYGFNTGTTPKEGAIVVLGNHVAYVEHVYDDGSYKISEMNYYGSECYHTRTINDSADFIYECCLLACDNGCYKGCATQGGASSKEQIFDNKESAQGNITDPFFAISRLPVVGFSSFSISSSTPTTFLTETLLSTFKLKATGIEDELSALQCDPEMYPGVQHCTDNSGYTHIIVVDLNDPHVRVLTVLSSGPNGECNSVNHSGKDPSSNCPSPYPFETLTSMLGRYTASGAVAIINTDYFGRDGDHGAEGLAVRNGQRLDGVAHGDTDGNATKRSSLAFSSSNAATIGKPANEDQIDTGGTYYNAVAGGPTIVRNGQALGNNACSEDDLSLSACTSTAQSAAGLTNDGRLILVTASGKDAAGMASYLSTNYQVHTALKFDGGGSARLAWLDSAGRIQSYGATGENRPVAEGLLVFSIDSPCCLYDYPYCWQPGGQAGGEQTLPISTVEFPFPTSTPIAFPTATPSPTSTPTPTATVTPTAIPTFTPTFTNTPPPTSTSTATPTVIPQPSVTPTRTATPLPDSNPPQGSPTINNGVGETWSLDSEPSSATITMALNPEKPSSVHYRVQSSVAGIGGGEKTSASYRVQNTTGQSSSAATSPNPFHSSEDFRLFSGYWGATVWPCISGDLDCSCRVDIEDIMFVAGR